MGAVPMIRILLVASGLFLIKIAEVILLTWLFAVRK